MSTHSQRGISLSVLVVMLIPVLLIAIGLAVDSARKSVATRQAEAVAAQGARLAIDTAAPYLASGQDGSATAIQSAKDFIATKPDVQGNVQYLGNGRLRIETTCQRPTILLSLIGIHQVTGHGIAEAQLFEE